MHIALEKHTFAPELNKIYLTNGRGVFTRYRPSKPMGGFINSIKDIRKKYFQPIAKPFLFVVITKTFPRKYDHLNRNISGRIEHRRDALKWIREDKDKNCYGEYVDMSHTEYVESYTMPTPKFKIKIRMVG